MVDIHILDELDILRHRSYSFNIENKAIIDLSKNLIFVPKLKYLYSFLKKA